MAVPAADDREASGAPAAGRPRGASLRLQAIASTAGNVAFFATLFVLTPLSIRELGAEGWGIWQLVGATAAYASLLSLALGTAIHYQVAYHLARGDVARLATAFTNARFYLGAAGLLLLALLFGAGEPLIRSLVEPALRGPAWSALVASVGLTAVSLPLRIYPSTLGGMQRLDLYGLIQFASALLLLPAIYLGFSAGMGLSTFVFLMTLGSLLPILPSWILARRLLPRGCLRFTRFDLPLFRELLAYSLSSLVYVAGTVVLYQTMKFVAAWRCGGAAAAGDMGLVISIVQTLGVVFVPLLGTLHARFGQLHGDERFDEIRELLERALVATGLLLVPGIVFLLAESPTIFEAWVGSELGETSLRELALATRIMLLGQAAYVFALPCYYALLGMGEHRPFGIGMLVAAVVNAVAGWFVAGVFPRVAALGLVFAIATTLLAGLVTFPFALRRFPIALTRVLARALLFPLAVSLLGLAAMRLKPASGQPMLELLGDGVLFSVCVVPWLEVARRRFLRANSHLSVAAETGRS